MRKTEKNKMVTLGKKIVMKKRPGGTKAILVEVILVLLAVAALLVYKEEVVDTINTVVANCKSFITSLIS